MKILLDENLPHRLRLALEGHDVVTVAHMGWAGVKNGDLLGRAEAGGFEVFVTADQNLKYQQNFAGRLIAMVYLTGQKWDEVSSRVGEILAAVEVAAPGSFQVVECGLSSG